MPNMLVLVPTRGRPDNALRLLRQYCDTATEGTEILFIADDDDPELAGYRKLVGTHLVIGPRRRLGGTLNYYAMQWIDGFDVIGFMGDDVVPRTPGWDQRVTDSMVPLGMVYCNDGVHGPALPTAVFMSTDLIDALGHMVLPGMTHLFIDNYWKALGDRLGTLTYLSDVLLEHMHPLVGKGADDTTYQEANDMTVWCVDEALYINHIESGDLDREVSRVLA